MDLSKRYLCNDMKKRTILQMVRLNPEWSANRIQEGEKAIANYQEVVRIFEHYHQAKYVDDKLVDECNKCGLGLVHEIHKRVV